MSEIEPSGEIAPAGEPAAGASPAPQPHPAPGITEPAREPAAHAEPKPHDYTGWIPPDAHERVVDGFHRRLDDLAWASGLNPEEVRDALVLAKQQARTSRHVEAPQPDVKDDRGDWFYSPQQAAALAKHEISVAVAGLRDEMTDRLGPIEEASRIASRDQAAFDSLQHAASTWPHFMEHVEAITGAIRTARQQGVSLPLHEAYFYVVGSVLKSNETAQEARYRKKFLAELNDPATAIRRDVNPGRGPAASRKNDADKDTSDHIQDVVAELRARA